MTIESRRFKLNRITACIILVAGFIFLISSTLYSSAIAAFVGLGLTFWGALLLYVAPSKYVKLEVLNALTSLTLVNIEKILVNLNIENCRGIYLPPKYLKDVESSLVFIPMEDSQTLPEPEDVDEKKLYLENPKSIFLTPSGLALSRLFEAKLGTSFLRTDLRYIQLNLPKLLIEDLEIAENVEISIENSVITVEITNHIFTDACREIRRLKRAHTAMGCPLCSAIACALAKATGKPITILGEEISEDGKITKIKYQILEG